MIVRGKDLSFESGSVLYQVCILAVSVLLKYLLLAGNGFKAKRILFLANAFLFTLYIVVIFLIEYASLS